MLNYGNSENFRSFGRQIDTHIFFFLTPQVNWQANLDFLYYTE